MLGSLARRHRVPVAYVNQFGGNDDLVFDGRSCAFDAGGATIARGAAFAADVVVCDLDRGRPLEPLPDTEIESEVWHALVLGTRDYARKCGFTRAVLGLSGGIDSALTAAIAVEALGADHVLGVLMPSPFSSRGSIDDSLALAARLGIETLTLPIEPAMQAFDDTLRDAFAGAPRDVTEENIQARIRGNLLMALSNKRGALLLTTGNKSELAVGYCTLYGDMSGGLAVIADVPKTMVYRVARWLNQSCGIADHSRGDPDQSPVGGTAAQPDRSGLAAALRRARRHPPAPHRAPRTGRRDHRRRLRRRHRAPRPAPGPRRRVQAEAGRARTESDRPRVRHGLADADCREGGILTTNAVIAEIAEIQIRHSPNLCALSVLCVQSDSLIGGRRPETARGRPSRRRLATAGASTATAPDCGARTSRARRCSAA